MINNNSNILNKVKNNNNKNTKRNDIFDDNYNLKIKETEEQTKSSETKFNEIIKLLVD